MKEDLASTMHVICIYHMVDYMDKLLNDKRLKFYFDILCNIINEDHGQSISIKTSYYGFKSFLPCLAISYNLK